MTKKEKRLNLKNDIIFKAFFGRKGKEEYLKDFLESLLEIKILSINIQDEVSLEKLAEDEKSGRLDLQAELNDGKIVNIEMQKRPWGDIRIRSVFYASKIMAREMPTAIGYDNLPKAILINIIDYILFPYDEYISKSAIVLDKHREYVLTDNVECWYIELPKFRKQHPNMNIAINQWIAFIDDEDEELIQVAEKNNKTLKKARRYMDYLTGDAEVKRMAELREKWQWDYNFDMNSAREQGAKAGFEQGSKVGFEQGSKAGFEEGSKAGFEEGSKAGFEEGSKVGFEEGSKSEKIELVKKALLLGLSIEQIANITNLSKEEIEQIKKENKL